MMLYRTLCKLKDRSGLTDDLMSKIDVFYALGRLTTEEYNALMDVPAEEAPEDMPIEIEPIEPIE